MTSDKEQFKGRVAIVTGGARRIGAAIVGHLHGRGLDVLIHYRESRDDAAALCEALNGRRDASAAIQRADLADPDAPEIIAGAALEAFGRIDVLVNNASRFHPTPLERTDAADWDAIMATNLRAPWLLSQACIPHLREAGGAIVNLVDIHGLNPLARHAIYSQSKAGLVMQTRALARDLAPEVRVNGVAPGAILWPEHDDSPEASERVLANVPMGRSGEPGDIAGAVAFLALDAPYVTGQILAVDGGRLLSM